MTIAQPASAPAPRIPIAFDPTGHHYRVDDRAAPGVTSVIDGLLLDLSAIPSQLLADAALFGTAVHRMVELDLEGALDEANLDDRLRPYLANWRAFEAESGFVPLLVEARVASRKYAYAGTLDLFGDLPKHPAALIDVKSGLAPRSAGPQTAAYAQGLDETYGLRVRSRYALSLAGPRYRLVAQQDATDLNVFLAALTIKRWHARGAV